MGLRRVVRHAFSLPAHRIRASALGLWISNPASRPLPGNGCVSLISVVLDFGRISEWDAGIPASFQDFIGINIPDGLGLKIDINRVRLFF